MTSIRPSSLILLSGIIIGIIIAANLSDSEDDSTIVDFLPKDSVALGSQEATPPALLELQNTSEAFVYIAQKIIPSVVSIQTTRLVSADEIEKLHRDQDISDLFRFRSPEEFRQRGSGSGIIVTTNGYILTNVHVVEKADRLRVLLHDDREFEAKVIGMDPLTEVAVIKVDAENMQPAKLGDSQTVKVGQWVLAIGNPLELRSTVTAGIISATERQIDIINDNYSVESFFQTDAAINPGNSGGALVNLRGEVIGVNTAIATESGYNAGFGFAIPINLADKVMHDLLETGMVQRGFLGIAMQNMDKRKAAALSMNRPRGVFVDRVLSGSPAQKAGLRAKDVILQINDKEVNRSNQVQAAIAEKRPGDRIMVHFLRRGKHSRVDVILGQKEQHQTVANAKHAIGSHEPGLGIEIRSIDRKTAKDLKFVGRSGVLVIEVRRFSPAELAGIQQDDIIVEIDDKAIPNPDSFNEVVATIEPGDVCIFKVRRFGEDMHFFVEMPKN